jgi:hypothetical protein
MQFARWDRELAAIGAATGCNCCPGADYDILEGGV